MTRKPILLVIGKKARNDRILLTIVLTFYVFKVITNI